MKTILTLLYSISICISINSQTINDLRRFFNFDPSEDLNYRVLQTIDTTDATIFNVLYTGGNQMQVTAYLIIPKNNLRRYPAVIFLHGLGQDKNAFLSNALELAGKSFASLLIDDPPARTGSQQINYQNYTEPEKDLLVHRQSVIDVRRGIDLLQQHPKIDPDRIAFVGIDYGSWTGAIVAGVEYRILTYALIDCNSQPSLELRNSKDPQIVRIRNSITSEQLTLYEATLKKLDPIYYLGYHRNSNILFQFSQTNPAIPDSLFYKSFQVASEPKKMESYKVSSFDLISFPEALQNRKKWLYIHL